MSAILFSRAIGPIPIPVVISEQPESVLEITEIPIEDGAVITDHAHSAPFKISLEVASQGAAITYQALVDLQKQRVPFSYVSGFDIHTNLLIKRIAPERTSEFSRVFRGRIELQEVILVESASVPGDSSQSGDGGGVERQGGKRNPGGRKSRRAAKPAAKRASGGTVSDRASGTVNRGDIKTTPIATGSEKGQSVLSQISGFGG